MSEETYTPTEQTIPTVSEESGSLGDIKINLSVIASIVRLATLEVPGVLSAGGGITDLFKNDEQGVKVAEDEGGAYLIEVRVILKFGVELAKTALNIQQRVREQVMKMTSKPVSKVDVIIERVKLENENEQSEEDNWHTPNSTD